MRKQQNFTATNQAFARQAAQQLAQMEKSINALRDNISGLKGGLKVPVPKGGSRYIKGSRTNPSIFEQAGISSVGNYFASSFLSDIGLSKNGSFDASSSQLTSQWFDMFQQGQRIT